MLLHKYKWWYKHFNISSVEKLWTSHLKRRQVVCMVFPSQDFADLIQPDHTRQHQTLKSLKLCKRLLFAFKHINTKHIHIKVELSTSKHSCINISQTYCKWAECIICEASVPDRLCLNLHSNLTFVIQTAVEKQLNYKCEPQVSKQVTMDSSCVLDTVSSRQVYIFRDHSSLL